MTRDKAIKALGKLIGDRLIYRVYDWQTSPEQRQAARDERDRVKARMEAIEARTKELLAAIPEYVALTEERRLLYKRKERLSSEMCRYKFMAGVRRDIFTEVMAEGDTWEEVIAKVEARQKKSA